MGNHHSKRAKIRAVDGAHNTPLGPHEHTPCPLHTSQSDNCERLCKRIQSAAVSSVAYFLLEPVSHGWDVLHKPRPLRIRDCQLETRTCWVLRLNVELTNTVAYAVRIRLLRQRCMFMRSGWRVMGCINIPDTWCCRVMIAHDARV